jgi:hypothetical protein
VVEPGPAAVGSAGRVGDEDVGVELGIAGARGAVDVGGGEEAVALDEFMAAVAAPGPAGRPLHVVEAATTEARWAAGSGLDFEALPFRESSARKSEVASATGPVPGKDADRVPSHSRSPSAEQENSALPANGDGGSTTASCSAVSKTKDAAEPRTTTTLVIEMRPRRSETVELKLGRVRPGPGEPSGAMVSATNEAPEERARRTTAVVSPSGAAREAEAR